MNLDEELAKLASMRDDEIDTSDIPVLLDFSNPVIGKYRAQAIEARSGETGTGSTEGESAVAEGHAPQEPRP